jgi:glucose-6-phosphate isomerase
VDRLSLDIEKCMIGPGGAGPGETSLEDGTALTPKMLERFTPRLESARRAVLDAAGTGMLGWMDLPRQDPAPYLDFAARNAGRYECLLVIGIGGSALGTTALATALLPFYYNELSPKERGGRPRLYVLDNVDPDETAALLDRLDLERTLVNVISKSGTTGESMAGYLVARERLVGAVGAAALNNHLVFTTDPAGGVLRKIGEALGVPLFDVPPGVGGRFSVLSAVGLLPAALVGMDIEGLLAGARDMAEWVATAEGWDNPACRFAGVQFLQDTSLGRYVSVMMPYSARLRDVADWYRQLWAESLGKETDRQGRSVNVGPLPVKALGVTDQHSQLQLYAEGPDDKLITFLGVGEFDQTVTIPAPGPEAEALAYLGGHTLAELLWAEQKGTAWALAKRGRPSLTITLPRVDAFSVGALLYMLEMATAIAGELYDVDAFDQPGVELSKQATYALMGRAGYEALAQEIT